MNVGKCQVHDGQRLVHILVSGRQRRRHAHHVAIEATFADEQITYTELDSQSTQIAQWLLHHGATPETVVALTAERNITFLTGILGILKAGCVYMPLDPNYPEERLVRVLDSSQAPFILTTAEIQPKLESILENNEDSIGQRYQRDRLRNRHMLR